MSKIVASIAIALLVSASAFGGLIDQMQNTQIGLTNGISLLDGHQNASVAQNLALANLQEVIRPCPTWACQGLIGALGQIGSAVGEAAVIEVAQDIVGGALQAQEVGSGVGPKAQLQNIALVADQAVARTAGPGNGSALHTIVLRGEQDTSNAAGGMTESSSIMGIQTATIDGGPTATGIVDSTMVVTTTQTQASL